MAPVEMTCMTTKNKFDVEDPEVVVLRNGRYAYRAVCPWRGKNDKILTAYKFCSTDAYAAYMQKSEQSESKHSQEGEHIPDVEEP